MASERFLNLPEEKKNRILEAAIREFNRVPFDQVSINRIIQDAGIPRGSFYQYFENKEDLAIYLISGIIIHVEEGMEEYMRQDLGDLFVFFTYAIDYVMNIVKEDNNSYIFASIVPQFFRENGGLPQDKLDKQMMEAKTYLLTEMHKRYYEAISMDDLELAWELLWGLLKESICMAYVIGLNEAEVKASYHKKLQIIKIGFETKYLK